MKSQLDTMNFGQYRGKTIRYILDVHPQYLQWCLDNIKDFKLNKSALKQMYININKDRK